MQGLLIRCPVTGLLTVDEKLESSARLALGENNIATNVDDDWDKLFNNSMSTTDSRTAAKTKDS